MTTTPGWKYYITIELESTSMQNLHVLQVCYYLHLQGHTLLQNQRYNNSLLEKYSPTSQSHQKNMFNIQLDINIKHSDSNTSMIYLENNYIHNDQ